MKLPGDVRDSAAGIDGPQDQSLDPARYAELLRRIEGFEDGTAKARPAADVFADIRARWGGR